MTTDVKTLDPVADTVRAGARDVSAASWWFLPLGALWIWFGMFVLSYRVSSVAAVAAFVGAAFLFGGVTQLAQSMLIPGGWRWLYIIGGLLALVAGVITFAWPGITLYVVSIFVAWYLIAFGIIHFINALAGAKVAWWWTDLLLGIAEFVLGVWAARSWERSLFTLVTLVGVWAIFHGVSQIIGAFTLRDAGKRAERAIG